MHAIKLRKFVSKAISIHGNKYDYSNVEYINNRTKINIICLYHGEFLQLPKTHIRGSGCPKCGINKLKSTIDLFISKAISIHGDKYGYSKVKYINYYSKIIIICKTHGEFLQLPLYHLRGYGCKKCANSKLTEPKTFAVDYKKRANNVHNNKYKYELDNKIKVADNIKIICPQHGLFLQSAINHLTGKGCPNCAIVVVADSNRLNIDEFIKRAINTHGSKYDYSESIYITNSKIKIRCRQHGVFYQMPSEHIRGCGCKACSTVISKPHRKLLEYLNKSYNERILINDRKIIKPYEIDILIADRNIGIEVHGGYWHSYSKLESKAQKFQHYNKHDLCIRSGIKLLQFYDFELYNSEKIVHSIINCNLANNKKIYAEKCEIIKITNSDSCEFFNMNHICGFKNAKYYYGLVYDNNIVHMMSFSYNGKVFEITQSADIVNTVVVGAVFKLLKYFLKTMSIMNVVVNVDRRFSAGDVYRQIGFKCIDVINPGYCYLNKDGSYAYSKECCLFEPLDMFTAGYRRLWDAGYYKLFLYTEQT